MQGTGRRAQGAGTHWLLSIPAEFGPVLIAAARRSPLAAPARADFFKTIATCNDFFK